MTGTSIAERQRQFAVALMDPTMSIPSGLVGPGEASARRRFDVYRNNVICSLVEALQAAFPVVRRLVGETFFSAMARHYACRSLPATPMMLDYGADFAGFIGRFEPAAVLPYLPDVARLERAWLEAYHAAEASPMPPESLREADTDRLATRGFAMHPSMRIVRLAHPVVALWQMNRDSEVPHAIELARTGEDALIVRPAAEVAVHVLPAGVASFIKALASGRSIVGATSAALADDRRFQLAGALTGLLRAGAVVGWHSRDACHEDGAGGGA